MSLAQSGRAGRTGVASNKRPTPQGSYLSLPFAVWPAALRKSAPPKLCVIRLPTHRCRPASSRLRHIIGVHLETALTDTGGGRCSETPQERLSFYLVSLESVPLSVQLSGPSSLGADAGMTGFSLSLPRSGSHQLQAAWAGCLGGLGSPACNPSIFWAVGQSRHEGGGLYTALGGKGGVHRGVQGAAPVIRFVVSPLVTSQMLARQPLRGFPCARIGAPSAARSV